MKILIVSGSRADWGLLEWPIKTLEADSFFQGKVLKIWGRNFPTAFNETWEEIIMERPDLMLVLGDRFEILAAATAAHLARVPIAHIAGGDITEGSYDDAMRDCISRMATIHFACSHEAAMRLVSLGFKRVHMVGSPGVDYIMHAPWQDDKTPGKPYVVVAYYPETIDGTVALAEVTAAIGSRDAIWCSQNLDIGHEDMPKGQEFTHDEFLNLIAHCEEFIGNSSAMIYEAPFLGVKTRMIGKRQRGRVIPFGDGKASERIRDVLKYTVL